MHFGLGQSSGRWPWSQFSVRKCPSGLGKGSPPRLDSGSRAGWEKTSRSNPVWNISQRSRRGLQSHTGPLSGCGQVSVWHSSPDNNGDCLSAWCFLRMFIQSSTEHSSNCLVRALGLFPSCREWLTGPCVHLCTVRGVGRGIYMAWQLTPQGCEVRTLLYTTCQGKCLLQ